MEEPPGHYFSPSPEVASNPSTVPLDLPDLHVELTTDRGMFSPDRVDTGTRLLLLEAARPPVGTTNAIDVGCGYGPIALTLAMRCPTATVWAIDVNARARDLCAANAAHLGLTNVMVMSPDEVPPDIMFDYLASNPPIRIGKAALRGLLDHWLRRLSPGSIADLVVQKHLGSDSLQRWLSDQCHWPTERVVSRQGYRVLRVTMPAPSAETATPPTTGTSH